MEADSETGIGFEGGPESKWPKAIGVVGLVFGVLGALGAVWGLASGFLGELLAAMSQVPVEFYEKWRPFTITSSLVMGALGALLAWGGYLVLKRRKAGVTVVRSWAVAKVVAGLGSLFVTVPMTREQMEITMKQQAAGAPEAAEAVGTIVEGVMFVSIGFGVLWLLALPAFMLIWFGRAKVRAEVAGWS